MVQFAMRVSLDGQGPEGVTSKAEAGELSEDARELRRCARDRNPSSSTLNDSDGGRVKGSGDGRVN